MGDYVAIRYKLVIKEEHRESVRQQNILRQGAEPLNWKAASLQFNGPEDQKVWQEFLDHKISERFPDAVVLHHNPENWDYIPGHFNHETGELQGTDCFKVIPGGLQTLERVLPLLASEWKIEVAIKDLLFSNGDYDTYGCELVDIYAHTGNDLYKDRVEKARVADEEEHGTQWGYR